MDITITLPDLLVTEYLGAMSRVNRRQHQSQRLPEPFSLDAADVEAVLRNHLYATILRDVQEQSQIAQEAATRQRRTELEAL